jgi:hypothetical protein
MRVFFATMVLLVGMTLAGTALAQDTGNAQPPARGRRGAQRVIRLEEITIEGRIQKPNAFFVLQRSNLGFAVLDLRTTFLQEIIRSVGREPF